MTFLLAPRRKGIIFCIESHIVVRMAECRSGTFSLHDWQQCR